MSTSKQTQPESVLTTLRDFFGGTNAKKGYWGTLDQAIVSGGNFLVMLLLGRSVPPTEFGVFVIGWTTLMIFLSIQNALILSPMSVLGPQKSANDCQIFFGSLTCYQILLGSFLTILLLSSGICWPIFAQNNIELGKVLTLLGLINFFFLGQEFYRRILLTTLSVKEAFFNDLITNTMRIGGIVYLLTNALFTINNCLLVIGASSTVGCIAGYTRTRHLVNISIRHINQDIKESWQFGKWVFAELLPQTLSVQGYTYLTAAYVNYAAAAALGASQNILNATNVLLLACVNIVTPMASKKHTLEGENGLNRFMVKCSVIMAIPVLGFYLVTAGFAEQILAIVYKDNYIGYGPLLSVCTAYFSLSFFNRILQIYLYASKRPQIGFFSKSLSFLIMIICAYPLLINYGVYGAVFGTIISQVIILCSVGSIIIKGSKKK